jgi:hypothetical protein
MAFKSTYTISEFLSWRSYEMLNLAPKMNFKELVFLFHLLEVFNKRRMDAPTTPPITDNVLGTHDVLVPVKGLAQDLPPDRLPCRKSCDREHVPKAEA